MHSHNRSHSQRRSLRSLISVTAFVLVAVFLLWTEHRAHLLGALPWLFLLACLFIHTFMHHGHGHHDDHGTTKGSEQ